MCLETISAWILIAISIVTAVCGVTIMGVGAGLAAGLTEYGESVLAFLVGDSLDGDTYLSAVYIMIPVGTLLCLSAFLGCWGSWRRKQFWLLLFNILAIVILVMVLVSGILASVYRSSYDAQGMETAFIDQVNQEYGQPNQDDVTNAWDSMQNSLACCGALSYTDWEGSAYKNETSNIVPWSCCVAYHGINPPGTSPGYDACKNETEKAAPDINIVHTEGCLNKFQDDVYANADTIMGVCFSLGLLNLIGVGLGCFLRGKLEDDTG